MKGAGLASATRHLRDYVKRCKFDEEYEVTHANGAETFEQLIPSAPAGRFDGIDRPYSPADVARLRGSVPIAYTLAERGANRLWELLQDRPYVNALGAVTGNQAMQMVRAGLEAIYLSGWQVAADCEHRRRHVPRPIAFIPPIPGLSSRAASTGRSSAPTRSSMRKAARSATGSRRSWPMPRPGSAARSTRSRS